MANLGLDDTDIDDIKACLLFLSANGEVVRQM